MTEERDLQRERLFADFFENGSVQARGALIESYGPLAEFFAGRYRNRGADSEDLRQVAQLALIKALDRFDPEVGVKFSTFAGRTIDGELKRYFRDKTWTVRVPRALKELSADVRRTADQLAMEHGRAATVDEIAGQLGVEVDSVIEALDVKGAYRPTSLDRPAGVEGDSSTIGDLVGGDDPAMARQEATMTVRTLLATLPERERTILELRFYEDCSQSEIAERVGVSQMHVSRLLRRSFDRLRGQLEHGE